MRLYIVKSEYSSINNYEYINNDVPDHIKMLNINRVP